MKVQKPMIDSKIVSCQEEEERKIGGILLLLDEMYKMRFIERISRPISRRHRERIVQQYKKKFDELHVRINEIKYEDSETCSAHKDKIGKSTKATRPINWKNQLKKVASKYNQILVQGSFKHYEKIAAMYSLSHLMKTFDTNTWLGSFTSNLEKGEQKCC